MKIPRKICQPGPGRQKTAHSLGKMGEEFNGVTICKGVGRVERKTTRGW